MLKTTGISKKYEEMKNGGYTLFSDKTRKMLLAMGLSLLSIGMLGQTTYAQMSADVVFQKNQRVANNDHDNLGEGNVRYQITLNESDTRYQLEGLYLGEEKLVPYVGILEGRQNTLVVVEVPAATESIVLKNTNENDVNGYTITLKGENINIPVDNDGPEIEEGSLVQYDTETEKYLQAKFNDNTKIYRVEDEERHNRVIIKEKDRDKVVNLKYILEEDDNEFTIYDILGNPTTISLDQTVPVVITYNTRNVDGTQLALNVDDVIVAKETKMVEKRNEDGKLVDENDEVIEDEEGKLIGGKEVVMVPEEIDVEYKLIGIKTGSGQPVPTVENQGDIYTGVPDGTTKIILVYREEVEEGEEARIKRVTVPLILDKEAPVVIAYKAEGDNEAGYTVTKSNEETAKARAYINGQKAIIEVKDVHSGIAKIQLLKGTKGNYKPDDTITETVTSDIVYDESTLVPSLLKVFDVTPNTTAVRIYDGVGNELELALGISNEPDAVTIAKLEYNEDAKTYTLVAQDIRAGLGSIRQSGTTLADFTSVGGENDKYDQYTLDKVEIVVDAHGDPIVEIYDALGNKKSVSFDEFLYVCTYATYSEHNDAIDSGTVSISVKDNRGICRIEVTMVDKDAGDEPEVGEEPTSPRLATRPVMGDEDFEVNMNIWNEWNEYDRAKNANETWNAQYRHTYTLERFRGELPTEVIKTYAIPDGKVECVMVYTKYEESENGIEEFHNTIDNVIDSTNVESIDRIKTTKNDLIKDGSNRIIGARVTSTYGIKQIEYKDKSVVRFYSELPTELYVNCLITSETGQVNFNGAVVTDAIGDKLIIESDKVTFSYNETEVK